MDVGKTPEEREAQRIARDYPSVAAQYICEHLVPKWQKKFLEKNAGYGDMHNELGLAAQYVDIHRKVGKLRRAMWDRKEIGPEDLSEVLMDLIGHCFLTLDIIGKNGEDPWEGMF